MHTEDELRQCIGRSRQEGFRMLFEQYHAYVYTIVWNRLSAVGTREDAEECVADVFTELFLHFEEVHVGTLHGFIGTLARRKAIRFFHRLAAQEPSLSLDEAPELTADDNVERSYEQSNARSALLDAVQALGEPDATILLLRHYYDRSSAEIAKQLHLKPITVRVRMSRALRRLQQSLTESGLYGKGEIE